MDANWLAAHQPMDAEAQGRALELLAPHPVLRAEAANIGGRLYVRVQLASGTRHLRTLAAVLMIIEPVQLDDDGNLIAR